MSNEEFAITNNPIRYSKAGVCIEALILHLLLLILQILNGMNGVVNGHQRHADDAGPQSLERQMQKEKGD